MRILILAILLSGCTVRNWSETIELTDGSHVCTWAQTNVLAPSMSGARNCSEGVVTNYATSQEDVVTVAVREGIRGAAMVWGADILSNGLSRSGDQIQNTATGGAGGSNLNLNQNSNKNTIGGWR